MKRMVLACVLGVVLVAGCLGLPTRTSTDPLTGVVVERTLEEQIAVLEAEAAQLQLTIDSLQASAPFLPPPLDLVVMGILASLSAALERQRRKLRSELVARNAADNPVPSA